MKDDDSRLLATKRISQRYIFFFKWIVPLFFVSLFTITTFELGLVHWIVLLLAVVVACFPVPVFGLPVFGKPIWMFADEVRDGGNFLWVRRGNIQDYVPLENISDMAFLQLVRPAQLTLHLVNPCKFGRCIVFSPPAPSFWNPFARNAIVEDLMLRVKQARHVGPKSSGVSTS